MHYRTITTKIIDFSEKYPLSSGDFPSKSDLSTIVNYYLAAHAPDFTHGAYALIHEEASLGTFDCDPSTSGENVRAYRYDDNDNNAVWRIALAATPNGLDVNFQRGDVERVEHGTNTSYTTLSCDTISLETLESFGLLDNDDYDEDDDYGYDYA